METQTKTPVQIIQELIAVHTSRIEIGQKFEAKSPSLATAGAIALAKQQSDRFTAELMNELSGFGDAVMATVDNQNEYQQLYKSVLGKLDSMTPYEAEQTFKSLEVALKHVYITLLEAGKELPASLQEIINQQASAL